MQEIRFFATLAKGFRYPPIFLWLGAWFYWLFGNGFTQIPRLLSRSAIEKEERVVNTDGTAGGFEYSDAYLHDNDSRFVFQFIRSAMDRGCIAANYVESTGVERTDDMKKAPGLMEACEILFGSKAQEKFDEYFQEQEIL